MPACTSRLRRRGGSPRARDRCRRTRVSARDGGRRLPRRNRCPARIAPSAHPGAPRTTPWRTGGDEPAWPSVGCPVVGRYRRPAPATGEPRQNRPAWTPRRRFAVRAARRRTSYANDMGGRPAVSRPHRAFRLRGTPLIVSITDVSHNPSNDRSDVGSGWVKTSEVTCELHSKSLFIRSKVDCCKSGAKSLFANRKSVDPARSTRV